MAIQQTRHAPRSGEAGEGRNEQGDGLVSTWERRRELLDLQAGRPSADELTAGEPRRGALSRRRDPRPAATRDGEACRGGRELERQIAAGSVKKDGGERAAATGEEEENEIGTLLNGRL